MDFFAELYYLLWGCTNTNCCEFLLFCMYINCEATFKTSDLPLLKMSHSSFHWLTQSLIPLLTDWLSHSSTWGVLINLKILPVLDVQYRFLYCAMICLPIRTWRCAKMRIILNEKDRFLLRNDTHFFMETCEIEIKFGFWKKSFFVFFFISDKWFERWLMTERFAATTFDYGRFL